MLVLFIGLAGIKLALLLVLRKQLFEVHWRVQAPEIAWGDYVAFGVFVCLGVISLAELGRHCRSVGVKAVRAANAAVMGLGLLFIFLTFHEADKNYVYPILSGVLNWRSLGPYLSLNLFFRPPLLGAWLFGYGLIYYALARSGREDWGLWLTAFCAGAYGSGCLRGLAVYRDELLVADCLGLVAVAAGWRSPWSGSVGNARNEQGAVQRKGFALAWLLAPAAWTALFAGGLLYLSPVRSGTALAYFLGLAGTSVGLFSAATLLAWRKGFLAPWSAQALFYFAAFFLLANANYPVADNFNRTLCLGFEVPHYFGGELAVALALGLGAGVWERFWPRASLWWLDLTSLVLIAVALVDLRLTQIMGVRLEWGVLAMGSQPKMMWRMAKPYLPGALGGLGLAVLLYVLALRSLELWQRRSRTEGSGKAPARGFWYVAATAVLLGVLGLVMANPDKAEGQAELRLAQTSPLWKRVANRTLSRDQFLAAARALELGDFAARPASLSQQPRRDLNVVLVLMESTYNKYLSLFGGSEETQPLLSKYKERMEIFPNFFSNFACSIHARFAAFTSLYPSQDFNAFTLQRVPVKSVFEVLHDNGYSCSMFYSSYFDYTGFRDFLNQRGLDEMYDADTMPGERTTERVSWGLREEETLGAIRSQIKKYALGNQRFFLSYVPATPHYPYEKVPAPFHRFKAGEMGDYTPFYLNDLLYMDWVLASILDQLKESELLEKTLVVITDDHGEMLGAHGGPIGHGWLLSPELVNAPLIILDPQHPGYHINQSIGSQIDLLPTLLDRLKIPLPADQLYEGRSLDAAEKPAGQVAYLNSFQQYGILDSNYIVIGDRQKGGAQTSDCGKQVYAISNQGCKTVFSQETMAIEPSIAIRRFDEFQENLLRNYAFYREMLRRQ